MIRVNTLQVVSIAMSYVEVFGRDGLDELYDTPAVELGDAMDTAVSVIHAWESDRAVPDHLCREMIAIAEANGCGAMTFCDD